jgi:hypothetical protein
VGIAYHTKQICSVNESYEVNKVYCVVVMYSGE